MRSESDIREFGFIDLGQGSLPALIQSVGSCVDSLSNMVVGPVACALL